MNDFPPLYLYLTKKDWVKPWIEGGMIPLNKASTYKKDYRGGIYTPDENVQKQLKGMSYDHLDHVVKADDTSTVDIRIGTFVRNDEVAGKDVHYFQTYQEAIILCFSLSCDRELMEKFGKEACVEILNPDILFRSINESIGMEGIAKEVEYTDGKDRNHFLKSMEDQWQQEYRMIWLQEEEVWVEVPKGVGREIIFD